jgi:purine-binding chemotaxis protein CheW
MEKELQLVAFKLHGEEYGMNILNVQEINRLLDITRVPKAPYFIEGVINLRGNVIPVLDLRKRFGLPERTNTDSTRVIITKLEDSVVGMVVDAVSEVLRINDSSIEPPPSIMGNLDIEFIDGVGKMGDRLIILLNIPKVMGVTEEITL